ncbi:MAG TPA: hypothetical protein PLO51_01810 [Candidatus Micrarchaeota archaeon]|nr:hypothetical protein [Candidatus Micrarchaeota archaeon]
MFGNPKWFSPRKFGWGLGLKSWQGIAYILVFAALVLVINALPVPLDFRLGLSALVLGILVIDVLHIMTQVYSHLDEREQMHQAIAERNSTFVAVVGLVVYGFYLSLTVKPDALEPLLLPLVAVGLAMAAAKGFTLIYLERKS